MYYKTTESLLAFIKKSPTAFQATAEMEKKFAENGYQLLSEQEYWKLQPGGKYIVTRNHSALIAFSIPKKECRKFHIIASHSDSPAFKIKENPEMRVENAYTKLNVEGYGGMLMAPWFDRPLSVAGRVVVRRDGSLKEELVNIDRDLVMIPSLAIHMNREANKGVSYNPQKDLLPLLGCGDSKPELLKIVAEEIKVKEEDILAHDLFLYNRMEGTIWGADREFVSAPRLDDLQCAFASMEGMLAGKHEKSIAVHCVLDNEEVGSGTKQGAASTFLADTLIRINHAMGRDEAGYRQSIANSFMLSADNAHGVHPNHTDKACPTNRPYPGNGVVIKYSANQKYTTDAISAAVFEEICNRANVPYQIYVNRSDILGGSTLGNISTTQVPVNTVDIGLAQLAMHSPYETGSVKDTDYMIQAMKTFFEASVRQTEDGYEIISR